MQIENLAQAKLVVVKVGSSLVTAEGKGIDQAALDLWAAQIVALKQKGVDVAAMFIDALETAVSGR